MKSALQYGCTSLADAAGTVTVQMQLLYICRSLMALAVNLKLQTGLLPDSLAADLDHKRTVQG